MRKTSVILFNVGVAGLLIGGAGIDGPTTVSSVALTVASFVVAAVGYRSWVMSRQKEASGKARKKRRREEIEAAEKAIADAKETTFQMWLTSCKLDVPF